MEKTKEKMTHISKELKYGHFSWDDTSKHFTIHSSGQTVALDKTYALAFVRFVLRIAQRNWFRKRV